MPLLRNSQNSEEDQQILVDNDFGNTDNNDVDNDDNAGYFDDSRFTAAAQPHTDFHNIQLPDRVLVDDEPPDAYNFTYVVFYLLGMATMTPWNFFVTAEDYWMYKFRNTSLNGSMETGSELTPMQKSFTCDLTLTASISGTTFLILNAVYGQKVSMKVKMLGTLSLILVIFMITTGFVEVNTDQWQEQFFLITLLTVVFINISSATMSGAIFGVAGLFPSQYMTALVSGQALGGIFTALAFIMVLAFGAGPNATAFIYFIIGSFIILLCIISYVLMTRQSFYKYYLEGENKYTIVTDTPSHSLALNTCVALEPNVREVFSKIYVQAASICLLYATTLSVYPGVTVLMQSQNYGSHSAWSDTYYMPVVNYLLFNSGDYFGRILAGIFEVPRKNIYTVLLMVVLRNLYIPFFLCSNSDVHQYLPILVHSDIAFILMIVTFSLSNGYITNIILIMAPRAVMQHEKEIASSIMAASLSCGLALGSMLSMMFVQML